MRMEDLAQPFNPIMIFKVLQYTDSLLLKRLRDSSFKLFELSGRNRNVLLMNWFQLAPETRQCFRVAHSDTTTARSTLQYNLGRPSLSQVDMGSSPPTKQNTADPHRKQQPHGKHLLQSP